MRLEMYKFKFDQRIGITAILTIDQDNISQISFNNVWLLARLQVFKHYVTSVFRYRFRAYVTTIFHFAYRDRVC